MTADRDQRIEAMKATRAAARYLRERAVAKSGFRDFSLVERALACHDAITKGQMNSWDDLREAIVVGAVNRRSDDLFRHEV